MNLSDPIRFVKGIGPKKAEQFEKLGLHTLQDVLNFYPRAYEDRSTVVPIDRLPDGEKVCVRAVVGASPSTARLRRGMELTRCTVFDESGTLLLRFFQQRYVERALIPGEEYLFYGKVQYENGRPVMVAPAFETPRPGRQGGRIMPIYSLTAGLRQGDVHRAAEAALGALPEHMEDVLPPEVRERYGFAPIRDAIRAIHCPQTMQQAQAARRRSAFEELFLLSCGLSQLRQRRAGVHGLPMKDLSLRLFYRALPFELTGAQQRAIEQCCLDIAEGRPLSRLIQGDVGSGKTMVAAALGFLAARNGYQTAIMAPTELLAQQHLQTMQPLFGKMGIK
ncbi:MAG: DEAD/DEAH box helicase, partial [Butyricicoccaceae bacterium]